MHNQRKYHLSFAALASSIFLSVPACANIDGAMGAVEVASADALALAIDQGAAHIVISAHLDLSQLPTVIQTGDRNNNATATVRTLFVDPASLVSVRVCACARCHHVLQHAIQHSQNIFMSSQSWVGWALRARRHQSFVMCFV